jgi:UDP-N-acetylglucosamine 2-epimerase (non-hydrolysing)
VTIEVGTNVLIGSDREKLIREVGKIVDGKPKKGEIPPFWDGRAAERIVSVLRRELAK